MDPIHNLPHTDNDPHILPLPPLPIQNNHQFNNPIHHNPFNNNQLNNNNPANNQYNNNNNQMNNGNENNQINNTVGATRWCKHKGPCLENTIRGLLRGFLLGYGLRATLVLIATVMLGKGRKKGTGKGLAVLVQSVVHSIFSRVALRFGLFLAGYISGFKGVQCLMRRVRGREDGINSAIAGAVAGASFYLLADHEANKSVDKFSSLVPYALYLMLRALEACWRRLERSGYVKSIPQFNKILFALGTGTMFYAYSVEPESLRPSYKRFVLKMSGGRIVGTPEWQAAMRGKSPF